MSDYEGPPPAIDSTRVVAFASTVDPVLWTERQNLSGGMQIGRVPWLVISQELGGATAGEFRLLHCDQMWAAVGASRASTIDALREQAEEAYPGISGRWTYVDVSDAEAEDYMRRTFPLDVCSFCDRVRNTSMMKGRRASICNDCVEQMHSLIHGNG